MPLSDVSVTGTTQGPLRLRVAPTATSDYGLLSVGSDLFDGVTTGFFVGSANGTAYAANLGSTFTGNMVDLQLAGVRVFSVDYTGKILANSIKLTTGAQSGYVLTSDADGDGTWAAVDHGSLTGLSDDDHTQYHTDARGDARYSLLTHNHDTAYAALSHSHAASDITSGTLGVARGGTGLSTIAANSLLYASAADTLAALAAGTNTHILTMVSGVPTHHS